MQSGFYHAGSKLWVLVPVLLCGSAVRAQIQAAPPVAGDADPHYTLRVTAREVVLDVIARDKDDRPVGDLKGSDFQIFEVPNGKDRHQRKLSAFATIDPAAKAATARMQSGGFQVALSGGCAPGTTVHYRLSFQPGADGWKGGYHQILVATTRPGITLIFRHRYYVGMTEDDAPARLAPGKATDAALQRAACFHPDVPASIALRGRLVATGPAEPQRFSLVIQPNSLEFSSMAGAGHRVVLDYGACLFNQEGKALYFLHSSANKALSEAEYEKVLDQGFSNILNLPRKGDPVLVRFVVRDGVTGNLGTIDLATELGMMFAAQERAPKNKHWEVAQGRPVLAKGTAGSFGTIVPQPGSLCGDVYELDSGTRKIISNFGEQDAVGSLHSYTLNQQPALVTEGLSGIAPIGEWFSIDYYGEFWTQVKGKYQFLLTSDDGAKLLIDDKLVIEQDGLHQSAEKEDEVKLEPGRHTIHVPYFQGPGYVSLVLMVRAPGKGWEVFDTRSFPAPGVEVAQR